MEQPNNPPKCLAWKQVHSRQWAHPTDPSTILEPDYREIREFHVVRERRATHFAALKNCGLVPTNKVWTNKD